MERPRGTRKNKGGTVKVTVVAAKALGETGMHFVMLATGVEFTQETMVKTKGQSKDVWNEEFELNVEDARSEALFVKVYDCSSGTDVLVGEKKIPLIKMITQAFVDSWFPLENSSGGEIHLQVTYRAPPGGTMIIAHGQSPYQPAGGNPQDILGRPPMGSRPRTVGPRGRGTGNPL